MIKRHFSLKQKRISKKAMSFEQNNLNILIDFKEMSLMLILN